ncbi:hypothetical protein D3C87_112190 [compost metagenome]
MENCSFPLIREQALRRKNKKTKPKLGYKSKKLAQEEGLEPPTQRLTAACSTD